MNADQIVPRLPEGYRWATPDECMNWEQYIDIMVQVRVGGTDDEPWTDLAIQNL